MKFRVIYMVEVFNVNGRTSDEVLVARRFARNKKTADRIAKDKEYATLDVEIRKLGDNERMWVNPSEVEG